MKHNHKNGLLAITSLLLLMLCPLTISAASNMRGDVNSDGNVNIADVTFLIDYLLGGNSLDITTSTADTNGDGNINIADVTMLIDYLLGGVEFPPDEHEAEEFTVGDVTFFMVPVEGGTFMMGATSEQGSDANDRELPVHQVTVSSFYIGQTEVTQALWQAVMGENPSYFHGAELPVEKISWEDCQAFITKLNELTGMSFRLPTEAEWEFAARGGNKSLGYKYSGGNDPTSVAWYSYNDSWEMRGAGYYGTHAVATREPNELMIHDMSGNVHEWCQDWFGNYSSEAVTDPTGPASGSGRVYRGGSWYFDEWFCRVSFRNLFMPSNRSYGIGMRLAL